MEAGEQQVKAPQAVPVKARPAAPGEAPQVASGVELLRGSGGVGPVEASVEAIAGAAHRASGVAVPVASAVREGGVAVPVASVAAAPAAKSVEAAAVRGASGVGHQASVAAARASARGSANGAGGATTGPSVRRRPGSRTPSGWRSVVGESSCTARPASLW